MASELVPPRDQATEAPCAATEGDEWRHENPTALLQQLGDEYTRAAFEAVLDRPRSGRAVAAATDMSRPTAFRRLNALVELGLLETDRRIDGEDGHHHKRYRAVIDGFSVRIEDGDIDIVIESDTSAEPARIERRPECD
ncbi:hypothetical protein C479_03446 [Halovivax asiaticus JCM 14624]|uniref:HTH iclR-type domain-containing protein n=1 Tax=Halovivax asiaticus JCM 14624 TaxID=1227490 RepID=M0BTY9_9EURY|nr:helix-turn-helix domain-containing protein [Halovivax asiaticus]ELZ13868.1 hypothetical protein C479_03446 [Halovivax asiaticus JCM 14624]